MEMLQKAASNPLTALSAGPLLARTMESAGRLDDAVTVHLGLVQARPQSRLDLVRLLIEKNLRLSENRRRWQEVDRRLKEAEQAIPTAVEELTLLRADLLSAQGRAQEAEKVLAAALANSPRNVKYRVALARLAQSQNGDLKPFQILDQAERELGPSAELEFARLDIWAQRGGSEASAAVAKIAEARNQFPATSRREFLDRLAQVEARLGDWIQARQYCRELVALDPANLQLLMVQFDLAVQAKDDLESQQLIDRMHALEGSDGTNWRYCQACATA